MNKKIIASDQQRKETEETREKDKAREEAEKVEAREKDKAREEAEKVEAREKHREEHREEPREEARARDKAREEEERRKDTFNEPSMVFLDLERIFKKTDEFFIQFDKVLQERSGLRKEIEAHEEWELTFLVKKVALERILLKSKNTKKKTDLKTRIDQLDKDINTEKTQKEAKVAKELSLIKNLEIDIKVVEAQLAEQHRKFHAQFSYVETDKSVLEISNEIAKAITKIKKNKKFINEIKDKLFLSEEAPLFKHRLLAVNLIDIYKYLPSKRSYYRILKVSPAILSSALKDEASSEGLAMVKLSLQITNMDQLYGKVCRAAQHEGGFMRKYFFKILNLYHKKIDSSRRIKKLFKKLHTLEKLVQDLASKEMDYANLDRQISRNKLSWWKMKIARHALPATEKLILLNKQKQNKIKNEVLILRNNTLAKLTKRLHKMPGYEGNTEKSILNLINETTDLTEFA